MTWQQIFHPTRNETLWKKGTKCLFHFSDHLLSYTRELSPQASGFPARLRVEHTCGANSSTWTADMVCDKSASTDLTPNCYSQNSNSEVIQRTSLLLPLHLYTYPQVLQSNIFFLKMKQNPRPIQGKKSVFSIIQYHFT